MRVAVRTDTLQVVRKNFEVSSTTLTTSYPVILGGNSKLQSMPSYKFQTD